MQVILLVLSWCTTFQVALGSGRFLMEVGLLLLLAPNLVSLSARSLPSKPWCTTFQVALGTGRLIMEVELLFLLAPSLVSSSARSLPSEP